jgi:segregation and condensation protein B
METQEAKVVLEAALLTAEQPLSLGELRRMFNDEVGADTLRVLLDELRSNWAGRGSNWFRWLRDGASRVQR